MTLDEIVRISLPDADWRAVQQSGGVAFVSLSDFTTCAGDVLWANFSIWAAVLSVSSSQEADVTGSLMRHRVRQGHPVRVPVVVAGFPGTRFEYTDGVRHIHSYFVQHSRGAVIEFTLATFLHASGAPKVDLETAAQHLWGYVQWA